jgi:SAM-dependent methyltransferase
MIEALLNKEEFNYRSKQAWARNVEYWLTGHLRHVHDVGEYILRRVDYWRLRSDKRLPVLIDMGCGNAWLLGALQQASIPIEYIGLDSNAAFIDFAKNKYASVPNATFLTLDFNEDTRSRFAADLVVNAFNFFELPDLSFPMSNAANWLNEDGVLLASTIDKTYLILALSENWKEFHENLARYQQLPGVKYGFQKIDLGNGVSDTFEYPSVLYSSDDYISAALTNKLRLSGYKEHIFTATAVPKIYCHFEFRNENR